MTVSQVTCIDFLFSKYHHYSLKLLFPFRNCNQANSTLSRKKSLFSFNFHWLSHNIVHTSVPSTKLYVLWKMGTTLFIFYQHLSILGAQFNVSKNLFCKKGNYLPANMRTISHGLWENFITFEMVSFSLISQKQFVFLSVERWLCQSSDVILHRFSYFGLTTLLWSMCYYHRFFMHKNIEHSSVTFPWLRRPWVCGKSILNSETQKFHFIVLL